MPGECICMLLISLARKRLSLIEVLDLLLNVTWRMQASPTSAGCEEEGLVVCQGGHIGGQPGKTSSYGVTAV